MQQRSRTSNHTSRFTKYLGEGGADQVNRIFRQNHTLSDTQLVEVVVCEMFEIAEFSNPGNAEAQSRLLVKRAPQGPASMTLARTRRRTDDCEPVGEIGDADEREVGLGS